ncbi:MAG TPA: MgtC/SapB family protein [Candidatus Blautia intestinavium]|nr:MgtC/SapB family protein [Candidatus Blautia intestinavium]
MSIELLGESINELSIVSMALRILMSMVCSGVIGLERGKANQPAGMRTYMLVSLGACIVMITGDYVFYKYGTGDPARLGAQVVSGIGFLGAGSIMVSGKLRIRGLTTAAGLWTSACIGLVMGIGFFECGVIATVAVYIIIGYFKKLEDRITFYDGWFSVYVRVEDPSCFADLYDEVKKMGMKTGEVQLLDKKHECKEAIISVRNNSHRDRDEILSTLQNITGVSKARYVS